MAPATMLICTVGTSLFKPNLERISEAEHIAPRYQPLAEAYRKRNWDAVALALGDLPSEESICGAEINSIASLRERGYVDPACGLHFVHSATDDGRHIAAILKRYYRRRGHAPVEIIEVADLQDADPKRFRTKGLRTLARLICKVIRERSPAACAINATGGYKAQIAIAVLLGQAIGVPVFYKHERFPEIIAFPPMPVAFDLDIWMRASGMLFDLERNPEPAPADLYTDEWDEKYESLVERVPIDGRDYIELSATGQIFHDTFRSRFQGQREKILPPPVPQHRKQPPRLESAGWPGEHPEVETFMRRVTYDVPQVVNCSTHYFNPDLPERTRFRKGSKGIEGIYSNGSYTVKFMVKSSAETEYQEVAVMAVLNEWLASQS